MDERLLAWMAVQPHAGTGTAGRPCGAGRKDDARRQGGFHALQS